MSTPEPHESRMLEERLIRPFPATLNITLVGDELSADQNRELVQATADALLSRRLWLRIGDGEKAAGETLTLEVAEVDGLEEPEHNEPLVLILEYVLGCGEAVVEEGTIEVVRRVEGLRRAALSDSLERAAALLAEAMVERYELAEGLAWTSLRPAPAATVPRLALVTADQDAGGLEPALMDQIAIALFRAGLDVAPSRDVRRELARYGERLRGPLDATNAGLLGQRLGAPLLVQLTLTAPSGGEPAVSCSLVSSANGTSLGELVLPPGEGSPRSRAIGLANGLLAHLSAHPPAD